MLKHCTPLRIMTLGSVFAHDHPTEMLWSSTGVGGEKSGKFSGGRGAHPAGLPDPAAFGVSLTTVTGADDHLLTSSSNRLVCTGLVR